MSEYNIGDEEALDWMEERGWSANISEAKEQIALEKAEARGDREYIERYYDDW